MNTLHRLSLFLLALLLLGSPTLANNNTSVIQIAVSDLEARGVETNEALIISDRLRQELIQTGKFRVMERELMNRILEEKGLAQAGLCDGANCGGETGRLLGVSVLLVGSVGKIGSLYTISVRLIRVETGEVSFTTNFDYKGDIEDLLQKPIQTLSKRIVDATQPAPLPAKVEAIPAKPQPPPSVSVPMSGKTKWRLSLGAGTLLLASAAFYYNSRVLFHNDQAMKLDPLYLAAGTSGDAAQIYGQIKDHNDQATSAALIRTATGALAVLCATGFSLTFAF